MSDPSEPAPTKAHRTEQPSACAASSAAAPRTVILRHLLRTPPLVAEADLRAQAAQDFGPVESVTVLQHGSMVGSAFVDFATAEAAAKCVAQLDGTATTLAARWERFVQDPAAAPVSAELKAPKAQQQDTTTAAAMPGDAANAQADGPKLNRKQRRALARQHLQQNGGNDDAASAAPSGDQASQQRRSHNHGASADAASTASVDGGTLFVHGKHVAAIFDVFSFFKSHGIEGRLKNCVFVTTSRKPYFLVDCAKNRKFFTAALNVDGQSYKGEPVTVKPSAQTCDEYLEKKPDAVCSKKLDKKAPKPAGDSTDVAASRAPHEPVPATVELAASEASKEEVAAAAAASLAFKPRMLRKR
uniref:RRM domain-containing protein n=1 Tax=Neobodo designis TaxID=312471 RepID=A0A7S1LAF3_NEODS